MAGTVRVIQASQGVLVMSLVGEHDISTAATFRANVADAFASSGRVIIDLADATFIDSTVLGVLYDVVKQASVSPGETLAIVVTPGGAVHRTLDLTSFPAIAAVYDSRQRVLDEWRDEPGEIGAL